jgi:hypothetical protein
MEANTIVGLKFNLNSLSHAKIETCSRDPALISWTSMPTFDTSKTALEHPNLLGNDS